MASRELTNLIKELSEIIRDAPNKLTPTERNEEWTKIVLILPLLEGLGWNRATDVSYESSPEEAEGWLDFILKFEPSIGVEAKALDVSFPSDRNHPQVKKGLKQSRDRGASYFIWTNGDCWQFYSLALANAPVYQVILSDAGGTEGQAEVITDRLRIIEKGEFVKDPGIFDEGIRNNWKIVTLPAAWYSLFEENTDDLIQVVRKALPQELDFESDEILEFLKKLEISGDIPRPLKDRGKRRRTFSFPRDWEQLLNSYEPEYERARKRFRRGYNLKLAQWVINENYTPWSKSITWRCAGVPNEPNAKKQLGPVVAFFREWGFIKEEEGTDKYVRVEEGVPYLKKVLQ
jgi:predicted type IV restriction endonuclease